MNFRLKQITVQDFRSVRGQTTVELDAPVVLVHGPNGVGKTSLLSAVELGLTGNVAALSRGEADFLQHLPHKDAPEGMGHVGLTVAREGVESSTDLWLSKAGIRGKSILTGAESAFFSDRCYLAQSTLGRLLEIYQHQDPRRSGTPLTRFVKDLLRLDPLEGLIDGLHPVGHVSRLRAPAPQYWAARMGLPALQTDADSAEAEAARQALDLKSIETEIRDLTGDVWPTDQEIVPERLTAELARRRQMDDQVLTNLARQRREVEVTRVQVTSYAATDEGAAREAAEQALAAARADFAAWTEGDGKRIGVLFEAMRPTFPEIPPVENGAGAAHNIAAGLVKAETARLELLIAADAALGAELVQIDASVAQGNARLDLIDRELAETAGANQELARALAALVPHIHDDDHDCPVCGRDYRQVSEQPLAAHLSARITELTQTAGRLESLSRERSSNTGAVATAMRRADGLRSRRLKPEALAAAKRQLAQQQEWRNDLDALAEPARLGTAAQTALAAADLALAQLNSRDTALSGHRQQLTDQAAALQLSPPGADEGAGAIVERLLVEIDQRERAASERLDRLFRAEELVRQLESRRMALASADTTAKARRERMETLSAAKKEADRRIDVAKDLMDQARRHRTEIISQVFSHDLNTIWRDLFIRLAPEERFVPRFTLTETGSGPVEAVLETVYRTGGLGGDPRAMLSAGNLNTAALTLFLSLHLSVTPTLPLLIIDDPVQSMDEVHIAQFAALLRTLKALDRQVMIAVHERALFDYLSLELSPAFNGDRLITVELGRAPNDATTAAWDVKTFEADKAIAA